MLEDLGRIVLTLVAALLGAASPASSLTPTPVGSEIVVGSASGAVGVPDVGVAANGDAVIAWTQFQSIFFPPYPDEQWNVHSRRVDSLGVLSPAVVIAQPITLPPAGPPVVVPQVHVDVAADGSFAALIEAWSSFASVLETSAKRYDSADAPVSGRVLLASGFLDTFAQMARAPNGDMFVVWNEQTEGGNYTYSNIKGRRFTAAGVPLGAAFTVNTSTAFTQNIPSIAADASGNMIVVWHHLDDNCNCDKVDAQRFDASGNPVGGEITLAPAPYWNFFGGGSPSRIEVAFEPGGGFIIAFNTGVPSFRRFDANGTPLGPVFPVSPSSGDGVGAGLVVDSDGSFVVIWASEITPAPPSIRGQRFSPFGSPVGAEFQVNTAAVKPYHFPAAAGNGAGEFVVTWLNGDVPNTTVRMQRFASQPLMPNVPSLGPIGLVVLAGALVVVAQKTRKASA